MSQNHFHLPDRTSWVPFSLARRRISLAPCNRTTVNVEPCTEVFNTKKYYIKMEKKSSFTYPPKQKEQINLKIPNK